MVKSIVNKANDKLIIGRSKFIDIMPAVKIKLKSSIVVRMGVEQWYRPQNRLLIWIGTRSRITGGLITSPSIGF